MKSEDLFDAVSQADPELIEEARPRTMRRRYSRLIAAAAAVLVVVFVVGLFFGRWNPFSNRAPVASESSSSAPESGSVLEEDPKPQVSSRDPESLPPSSSLPEPSAEPEPLFHSEIPVEALSVSNYPEWPDMPEEPADFTVLDSFFSKTIPQFLKEAGGGNVAVSPISLYLSLAAAARCADGETRQQILDLLGEKDAESMLSLAHTVWNANYLNMENEKSVFATSLWFSDRLSPDGELLSALAENLYTSAFRGEMGSVEFAEAFRSWLNEQTENMLTDQVSGLRFSKDTAFAIADTVYFNQKWQMGAAGFFPRKSVFHGAQKDVSCDFLSSVWRTDSTYFYGKNFTALSLALHAGGYSMCFVLPDEGFTPADLLSDEEAIDLMVRGMRARRNDYSREYAPGTCGFDVKVAYVSFPKFDISSDLNLKDGLCGLGVTDCFSENADFSPLLGDTGAGISEINHAVRVAVDEEGVAAAAYTVMPVMIGMPKAGETSVRFNVDRPFLFFITGANGMPLFTGIVNQIEGDLPSSVSENTYDGISPEEVRSIRLEYENQTAAALSPTECEIYLEYLSGLRIEAAEDLEESRLTDPEANPYFTPATAVLTMKDGQEKSVFWKRYFPDPDDESQYEDLVSIDGKLFRAAQGSENGLRRFMMLPTSFLQDHGWTNPLFQTAIDS